VSTITPTSGFESGQDVVIQGNSFPSDPSRVSVTVGDVPCQVTSTSLKKITCHVQPKTTEHPLLDYNAGTQTNGYIGGTGFRYTRYDISSLGDQSVTGLKTAIANGPVPPVLESTIKATL